MQIGSQLGWRLYLFVRFRFMTFPAIVLAILLVLYVFFAAFCVDTGLFNVK